MKRCVASIAVMIACLFPGAIQADQVIEDEWEEAGVRRDGLYQSPTWDYQIRWDAPWEIDDTEVEPVSTDGMADSIAFKHGAANAFSYVVGGPLREFSNARSSEEILRFVAESLGPGEDPDIERSDILISNEVGDTAHAVVAFEDDSAFQWITAIEVQVTNVSAIIALGIVPIDNDLEEFLEDIGLIEVDGSPLLDAMTGRERDNVIDDAFAFTRGDMADQDDLLEPVVDHVIELLDDLDYVSDAWADDDITETEWPGMERIFSGWVDAEPDALDILPSGIDADIETAYLDFASLLTVCGENFEDWLVAPDESAASERAFDRHYTAYLNAISVGEELTSLLEDAGYDVTESVGEDIQTGSIRLPVASQKFFPAE